MIARPEISRRVKNYVRPVSAKKRTDRLIEVDGLHRPCVLAKRRRGGAGEPCWIRTSDLLIKSQLLYRLS